MSATLRFDLGSEAGHALAALAPALVAQLGGKFTSRWGGVGRPRWRCLTLGLRLPRDYGNAWRLLEQLSHLTGAALFAGDPAGNLMAARPVVRKTLRRLRTKLLLTLGLPWAYIVRNEELPFLGALRAEPDEAVNWLVYADWLTERPGPGREDMRRRGTLIQRLFSDKKLPVKNGSELLEAREFWAWLNGETGRGCGHEPVE